MKKVDLTINSVIVNDLESKKGVTKHYSDESFWFKGI